MIALRRAVVVFEWVLIGLFVLVLTMVLFDLPSAWNAQPCSVKSITPDCYPWGFEGPAGGSWNYASKKNYLVTSVFAAIVSCTALVSTLVLPQGRRIFVLLIGMALIYLSDFFLPLIV